MERKLSMGLGEAIQRLMHVELLRTRGITNVPEQMRAERDMIVAALNTQPLNLGVDCEDGEADDVAGVNLFAKSAATSCCRLMPADTSRKTRTPSPRKKAVAKTEE